MEKDLPPYQSPTERLIQQFIDWEFRGRGITFYDRPAHPEPVFEPFWHHDVGALPGINPNPPPAILIKIFGSLLGFSRKSKAPATQKPPQTTPEPVFLPEDQPRPIELQVAVPVTLDIRKDMTEQFLLGLTYCQKPLAFEILGLAEEIRVQFVASPGDANQVEHQLKAHFPSITVNRQTSSLFTQLYTLKEAEWSIDEYSLAREFMRPLRCITDFSPDPLTAVVGALAHLQEGELGLLQIIFEPTKRPWAESIWRAVTVDDDKPFIDTELVKQAQRKIARPLYGTIIRTLGLSQVGGRSEEISRGIAAALQILTEPSGNALMRYTQKCDLVDFFQDVAGRRARRSGMLLNSDELMSLVHLPSRGVQEPKLARQTTKTKRAPKVVSNPKGLFLGDNFHAGERTLVALTPEQRVRHLHVIGTSGTGKSTLLFNLIRQDIENGQGVAVLDPHGDLVDKLLGIVPPARIQDVVLLDPSDEEYSIGFNILSAHSTLEKNLLASDLVSVFQRLSGSWGDQMASVLNNAILAFLESDRGGTLADMRRFLLEPGFREQFLQTVRDQDIVYYWRKGFAHLAGNKSIGPVLTRLETFLSRKPIRYMVSQQTNRLDFSDILDTGKVFLAKLAQGMIGRENSYLLGTLLVSKLQQSAMSRQQQAEGSRRDFWIYIDEFHNFITPSMAEILSGARKYRIGLTLAHQELRQLQRDSEVASAVLQNPGTRICFRVGDDDAKKLADGFTSFEAKDLQNLNTGEAICRVGRSDFDFNLAVEFPTEPSIDEAAERSNAVIAASRAKYSTPRAAIEAMLYQAMDGAQTPQPTEPSRPSPSDSPQEVAQSEQSAATPAQPTTPPVPPTARSAPSAEPQELGRGGPKHKYLQHLIKQLAIGMNFEVEVEKEVLEGEGSADVALKKGDKRFAFEISITTDVKHELKNVRKCLKAKFDQVVMVGEDAGRLGKLQEAASKEFTATEQACLRFCRPDEISAILIELSAASASKDIVSHGRKTKVTYRPLTDDEARKRREILAQISTQSLKKLEDKKLEDKKRKGKKRKDR